MNMRNSKHQRGLTLIEILVAVLVISIGLLGVAGLHSYTLKNNFDSLLRSHASALAADIADRMRANRQVTIDTPELYRIALADSPPVIDDDSTRAARDLKDWRDAIAAALPQGLGAVNIDPATRIATITITWGERQDQFSDPAAAATMQFVTETEI